MKPLKSISVVVVALALVLASPAAAGAAGTWRQVPSPNSPGSNELLGAAGSSPAQVWAAGRVVNFSSNPATYRSLLLRFNGSSWVPAPHPGFAGNHLLRGVDAPAGNDAWAVGYRQVSSGGWRTLVQHWDGAAWSVVASPNPNLNGLNQFNAVKAVPGTPGKVWAVGSYSKPSASYGSLKLIAQRSGGTWRTFTTPAVTPADFLEAVDATGPTDAWAVGWGSTSPFGGTAVAITLRFNGSGWVSVPIPQPSPVMLFGVKAVAADDVWAVGHTYLGGPHWIPIILHFNGISWTRATLPAFPAGGQLRDIVALSPSNVYAFGLAGEGSNASSLVLRWDGTAWTRESTPSPAVGPKLFGGAAVGSGTVWGVGYRYDQTKAANQTFTIATTNG